MPAVRAISLVPSITESMLALGVTPLACTRFCEQPAFTHVGGTKDPDIDAIVALAPDVVLMDREENRRDDAERLAELGIDVFATHVTRVDDVPEMLAALADRLGVAAPPTAELSALEPLGLRAFVAIWRRP